MTLCHAYELRGWLRAEHAPAEIMAAINQVIASLTPAAETSSPTVVVSGGKSNATYLVELDRDRDVNLDEQIPTKAAPMGHSANSVAASEPLTPLPAVGAPKNTDPWPQEKKDRLWHLREVEKKSWSQIAAELDKTPSQCSGYHAYLRKKKAATPGKPQALPA